MNSYQIDNTFRRLNIYVPKNKKVPRKFFRLLKKIIPTNVPIHIVENEVASVCEVGWDLPPVAKLRLTEDLKKCLRAGWLKRLIWTIFPWVN